MGRKDFKRMATRDNVPTTYRGLVQEFDRRINSGTFDEKAVVEHLHSFFRNYENAQKYRPLKIPTQVIVCEGVELSEDFMTQTMIFHGQLLKRHPNGGGFVPVNQSASDPSKPLIEDSVYVGPFAMVYGNARLRGNVHISDHARIFGNVLVSGNVRITGHAWVCGDARVTGSDVFIADNVRIFDHAWITGRVRITGDAWISGNANIIGDDKLDQRLKNVLFMAGDTIIQSLQNKRTETKVEVLWICDGAWIYDYAQVSGISYIRGNAKIRGNYKAKGGEFFTGTFE